jgi:hypothetical protein
MDPNSSYRLAMRVGAYVKIIDDGGREYCEACNIPKVLDTDSTNWSDLLLDISSEIKLGSKNKLRVTYWDNLSHGYEEISSDQKLLHAIDMYWEIRRLSVQVCVMRNDDSDLMHDIERQENMPCVFQGSVDLDLASPPSDAQPPPNAQPPLDLASPLVEQFQSNTEVPWVDDDIEYVGLDDEDPIHDSSDSELDDGADYVVLEDELFVDDARGCETLVHATDLENPRIEVGVTFGDGDSFKKAIRQYAIKGEYEIAAPYSESTRYRAYCKSAQYKWRIHASQLQDGRTWQVFIMIFLPICCADFFD